MEGQGGGAIAMMLPDVNVLVYAFRGDVPQHPVSRSWLDAATAADARLGISPLVLAAVIRLVTNRRVFNQPSSLAESTAFAEGLLRQENVEVVEPGERHFAIFTRLCRETHTIGPGVTDAWYAALAIESGCVWITYDRDYARFPGLRWSRP